MSRLLLFAFAHLVPKLTALRRSFLVPKFHLGTLLLRQFHCQSRRDTVPLVPKLHLGTSLAPREIPFRAKSKKRYHIGALFLILTHGSLAAPAQARPQTALAPEPAPLPAPPVDFNHVPWNDGEALTYLISWGGFEAAQGTFVAHKIGDHWEFKLTLASRGMVDDFYPFTGTFWSILGTPPWRSVEYGEYRFEPSRIIKERTRINYAAHLGTREVWSQGQTHNFPVAEAGIDDIGSMLYHLRALPWKPGDKRTLTVYESNSEKEANVTCPARDTRAFGTWPSRPLLRLLALPGKGTHHRGGLTVWMTDDARHLPLHADLNFRYGSFSIDLIKADKTLPIPR